MEENQPKTGKYALTFGLILGGIGIAFALILYSMDLHYQGGMPVFAVSIILTLVFIILGMIQFKKDNSGLMSFGQALKIGVGVCLIGGIVGIFFNQVMLGVIDTEMMSKSMEFQKGQLMETTNLTTEQINGQMEMIQKFSTPTMQILFGLVYTIVVGFLASLIPALILKKTENIN